MATEDERLAVIASIHPMLAIKMKRDEEERKREGLVYKLCYEKTYGGGSTDSYDSSVTAANDEEAVKCAREKLQLKDMLARYDTDITDALLIAPDGRELPVPPYSKDRAK